MTEPKVTKIIVPLKGISTGERNPRAIYDSTSVKALSALGQITTQRASNVEPGSGLSQLALALVFPMYAERVLLNGQLNGRYQIRTEYQNHWFADMTLCGEAFVLGPFAPEDRELALKEEVEWLKAHHIPVCEPCIAKQTETGRTLRTEPDMEMIPIGKPGICKIDRVFQQPPPQHQWVAADFSGLERSVWSAMEQQSTSYFDLGTLHRKRIDKAVEIIFDEFKDHDIHAANPWVIDDTSYSRVFWVSKHGTSERICRKLIIEFVDDSDEVLFHDVAAAL